MGTVTRRTFISFATSRNVPFSSLDTGGPLSSMWNAQIIAAKTPILAVYAPTNKSSNPSLLKSQNQAGKLRLGPSTPNCVATSVNVPSRLFRNKRLARRDSNIQIGKPITVEIAPDNCFREAPSATPARWATSLNAPRPLFSNSCKETTHSYEQVEITIIVVVAHAAVWVG